jgi:hypothetical protein
VNTKHLFSIGGFVSRTVALSLIWLMLVIKVADKDMQNGIALNVTTHYERFVNYKSYTLYNHNEFISGMQGKLRWHPDNLIQSVILETANGSWIDIFHLLQFVCFAIIIYRMTNCTNKRDFFNNKSTANFKSWLT